MTTVVNLYKEPYDVYVGRPGKGQDGYFGNPSLAGVPCIICEGMHPTPRDTLPCFKDYFLARLDADPGFKVRVLELKGKRLGCFCKPKACHGDIIAGWLDGTDG